MGDSTEGCEDPRKLLDSDFQFLVHCERKLIMRGRLCALLCMVLSCLALSLSCAGCNRSLTRSNAAAIQSDVRAFAQTVAHDVTEQGPMAWSKHFADQPAFFMAVNGQMAFPSGAAAQAALPKVAQAYRHIDLQWGDDLRVDVLSPVFAVVAAPYREVQVNAGGQRVEDKGFFTGLAEYRDGHWQFRDAHWSSATPPTPLAPVPLP